MTDSAPAGAPPPEPPPPEPQPFSGQRLFEEPAPPTTIRVLHLDADLVVCDKPPFLSVHRGERSKDDERFVLQTLRDQIGSYLYPVHRLDRQTSGVLAFGLTKKMAAALQANLQATESRKEYLALVRGETEERVVCERPLAGANGEEQPARTTFERLATFSRCSLLRCTIDTGRHHQIRRHCDRIAHQIIGDGHHGKGRINRWFRTHHGLPRMFLHAWRLRVAHPRTGRMLALTAPLSEDLRAFLGRLPDVPPPVLRELSSG